MSDPEISGEEAFSYITEFCGVGPKVANCILLFSLGKYDRFPVDVWVQKSDEKLLRAGNTERDRGIREKEIRQVRRLRPAVFILLYQRIRTGIDVRNLEKSGIGSCFKIL